MELDDISGEVVDAAMKVHSELGPWIIGAGISIVFTA